MWRQLTCWVLISALGLVLSAVRADQATEDKTEASIPNLIRQLGSQQFPERESASQELDSRGAPALKALQEAAKDADCEVRRRAEILVERIEKRLENARILAPFRIRLKYEDMPVAEAVADFARKTGFPIQLGGDKAPLANRKITLDTGETTFWEAFDKFCQAGGLTENGMIQEKPLVVSPQNKEEVVRQRLEQLRQRDRLNAANTANQPLVLVNGKAPVLPTAQVGSIRLRVLPIQFSPFNQTKNANEVLLPLEVMPEPRLQWQAVLNYRIDKAIDDKGESLADRCQTQNGDATASRILANGMAIQLDSSSINPYGTTGFRHLPLKIEAPKNSKVLKELTGSITAQVQIPPQALMTIDNVLQMAGKTARGPDGVTLRVLEAGEAGGQLKLKVQMDTPNQIGAGFNARGQVFVRRVRVVNGGQVITETRGGNQSTLLIQDAKGQPLQVNISQNSTTMNGGGVSQEMTLSCPAPAGPDKNIKLVLHGSRIAMVHVPFSMKNVPLP